MGQVGTAGILPRWKPTVEEERERRSGRDGKTEREKETGESEVGLERKWRREERRRGAEEKRKGEENATRIEGEMEERTRKEEDI